MKQKYFLLALFVIISSFFFFSCEGEENYETNYKGTVVNALDHKPYPDLEVSVTNGENTYKTTHTGAAGNFEILVRSKEINSSYYLLVGDSSCAPVRKDLRGLGKPEIDLGVIEVEGPKAPIVTTDTVFSHKAGTAVCQANVVDGGRSFVSVRGVCWSTKENPTIYDNQKESGTTGEGKFEVSVSDLRLETTYYFRAYARNRIDISYGKQIAFTTGDGKAIIRTDSVFAITATSAKCAGNVVDEGDFAIKERGICWSLTPDPTTSDSVAHESAGVGPYVCSMRNLAVSTPYYVRTFVVNESNITTYGEVKPFETKDGKPQLSTGTPSSTATSISVSGTIIDNGGFAIDERGVCYSTDNTEPTIGGQKVTSGKGNGTFNVTISNLSPLTTYYVRAYAHNENGESYGEVRKIETKSGVPALTTSQPTAAATSISISGTITDNGGYPITERGFCYSTTSTEPTVSGEKVLCGQGNGTFNTSISGLTPSTTYHFRAYAKNDIEVGYGDSRTVTTKSGKAVVVLGEFSDTTSVSAVCSVTITDNGGATLQNSGICWNTMPNPTITNNKVPAGISLNTPYSCTLTNLSASTTYYVRGYAVTDVDVSYSAEVTLVTLDGYPIVGTTFDVESVTSNSLVCGGNVSSESQYPVLERGICYGTNPYPTLESATKKPGGTGAGYFSCTLTGLNTASNTYYIRAYAKNTNGTSYGEQVVVTPENYNYCNTLRSVSYGGHTYKIICLGLMNHNAAETACSNLVYAGLSGWSMPTKGLVQTILESYNVWGIESDGQDALLVEGQSSIWSGEYDSFCGGWAYYYIANYNHEIHHPQYVEKVPYYTWDDWCTSYPSSEMYGVFAVRKVQ